MNITYRQEEAANKQYTELLNNFQKNFNNNPEFKNIIEFDMVGNSIKKAMGMKGSNVHVLKSTQMLWLTMYQIYLQAEILISANIGGPNPCTVIRSDAIIDAENRVKTGSSIIDISK